MNPKINLSEENLEFLELQQENLRLRIENEYLKGLRRLRMEQQVKEKPNQTCSLPPTKI
ncbi:hypothetical protein LACDD01_00006 [Lactococcus sp. DD01]|nr:hypothetical protein LACDD01_00006 [Lactococcus sp. DD01]